MREGGTRCLSDGLFRRPYSGEQVLHPSMVRGLVRTDLRESVRELEHLLADVRAAAEDEDLEEIKSVLDGYFAGDGEDGGGVKPT